MEVTSSLPEMIQSVRPRLSTKLPDAPQADVGRDRTLRRGARIYFALCLTGSAPAIAATDSFEAGGSYWFVP